MRIRPYLPAPAGLLACGLLLWLAAQPLRSYDLFFHLAGGRYILEHGFSRVDPFSLTGTAGWVPHEWGFGVLCALLLKTLGAAGPALFVAALIAANVLLLHVALRRAGASDAHLLALVALGLVLGVQSSTWPQERPFHIGQLFFVLAVLGLQAWRAGNGRWLWAFPVLGLAWANLHGSWPLGPALLASSALGQSLDDPTPASRRRTVRALAAALAMFLVAGLSPDGLHIYLYPLQHALLPSTQTIYEWRPLDLEYRWSWAYLALFAGFFFVVGRARARRIAVLLPALVLGIAALKVQRHAPFAAVLLALALMEHAGLAHASESPSVFERLRARMERGLSAWSAGTSLALWPGIALLALVVMHAGRPLPVETRTHATIPVHLLQALREQPPGRVLNRFILGGPISYFAGAGFKVFIDSRNDPFPPAIHDAYEQLVLSRPGWEEALERYDPDYLVWDTVNPGNLLLDHLRERGGWREAVRDGGYVLWVRERSK
ncbi:hypothetical protein [Corallococcus llansteffanensis]|uniref:Glycosyltransferase RgtA/B/C/D-like domain-containing protein n=1 Tax=Corallococcus llansteffanensis TaxID=2316731 RepID=A0A3A8P882_9BACT|nr:hypothetical protein [Corallococcus llansteffanensis]RKH52707.1 hypothetical protein D7V93_27700 [Corallococcus llansteffanensis]